MISQIIYLIALLSKRGARAPKRKKTSSETKLKVSGHNQSMRKVLLLSLLVFLFLPSIFLFVLMQSWLKRGKHLHSSIIRATSICSVIGEMYFNALLFFCCNGGNGGRDALSHYLGFCICICICISAKMMPRCALEARICLIGVNSGNGEKC